MVVESELDLRIARGRAEHSCLKRMDQFMFCMTVTHQFDVYYRDGTYADCPKLFRRWQTCMRAKLRKPTEAATLLRDERLAAGDGEHVFAFREAYAAEAAERYGEPADAGSSPTPRSFSSPGGRV